MTNSEHGLVDGLMTGRPVAAAPRQKRQRTVRRLAGLAFVLVVAGCGNAARPADSPAVPEPPAATDLIGLWRVRNAVGDPQDAWLRVDAYGSQLIRACGESGGSWAASGGAVLMQIYYQEDGCGPAEWLGRVVGQRSVADGIELVAMDGSVLAELSKDGTPPWGPVNIPVLTPEEEQQLAESPVPGGLSPAGANDLIGTWHADAPTDPTLVLEADGTYHGSDGCNGAGGRWLLTAEGRLISTAGPSTAMYCDGLPAPSWFAGSAFATVANGVLTLHGADGATIGVLYSEPVAQPSHSDLLGRWVLEDGNPNAYLAFGADGRYEASDGCNVSGGGWARTPDSGITIVSPSGWTEIGCDNAPFPDLLARTVRVGLLGGDTIRLEDADGGTVATLVRAG